MFRVNNLDLLEKFRFYPSHYRFNGVNDQPWERVRLTRDIVNVRKMRQTRYLHGLFVMESVIILIMVVVESGTSDSMTRQDYADYNGVQNSTLH